MTRVGLVVVALIGAAMLMTSFPKKSRPHMAGVFLLAFAVSTAMAPLW